MSTCAHILYHEETGIDAGDQAVVAELRLWADDGHHDLVLETHVLVDRAPVVSGAKLLSPRLSEAQAIRHAIATFDNLVAAHPWADRLQAELTEVVP